MAKLMCPVKADPVSSSKVQGVNELNAALGD